ncbi:MAG: hypothetical protein AAGJ87_06155 [Pseudomonadota bacterium]
MSEIGSGIGYLAIDLALVGLFFQRWFTKRETLIWPLIAVHGVFVALHFVAEKVDFSTAGYDHAYVYGFVRNRLFEASLAYITLIAGFRSVLRHNAKLQNAVVKLLSHFFRVNLSRNSSVMTVFWGSALSKKEKARAMRPLARQLLAELLSDISPELDATLRRMQILDAANAGVTAARIKAANAGDDPAFLNELQKIIDGEAMACTDRLVAIKKARY